MKDKQYIDNIGRSILTSDGIIDLLKAGKNIDQLLVDENIETAQYNVFNDDSKLILYDETIKNQSIEEYDLKATENWATPKEFQKINLEIWLFSLCSSNKEKDRVKKELNMYEERNLFPLLKHLIFLVSHFRKNKIVWGVGRGSSVSSYILFLIGIHKVDSLKYQLDIEDFLR